MSDDTNRASVEANQYEVVILGGGLAGLTLALQIKGARPQTTILVVERQQHPVPEAAHKVGESTVEISAQYLQNILGLEEHLHEHQLRKFGLRFFFPAGDNRDITRRVEIGLGKPALLPSYQLDRGRFENALGCEIQQRGVRFLDGSKVERIALGGDAHSLHISQGKKEFDVQARWVVDASGRSSLLKRHLGLVKKAAHQANAVWFRIEQVIDIDTWSDDPGWHGRITNGQRYLSTVHLCGTGYWVWLIPLASRSTSVGIVTDPAIHAFDTMNRFERALAWLYAHEPQCAAAVDRCRADIQDFRIMKNYPYSCQQVYSSDRWCLTGEAGVFTDPLYSPGSDFIAMSNGLITDLVCRELGGEDIRERAVAYNNTYLNIANSWFNVYEQQYSLLGNARVMVTKYIWDTAVYWGSFGLLYFHDKIRALAYNRRLAIHSHRLSLLGARLQKFFREWAAIDQAALTDAFVDHYNPLTFMHKFQAAMAAPLSDAESDAEFVAHVQFLERLAGRIVSKVIADYATSTHNSAVQGQIHRWKADPLLARVMTLDREAAPTDPINTNWINLAHQPGYEEQEIVS